MLEVRGAGCKRQRHRGV